MQLLVDRIETHPLYETARKYCESWSNRQVRKKGKADPKAVLRIVKESAFFCESISVFNAAFRKKRSAAGCREGFSNGLGAEVL